MNYTLEYLSDGGYVVVRMGGRIVVEAARECALQVFRLAAENSCKKILLDCGDAIADTGISDIHKFFSQLEAMGCDRRMNIAIAFRRQPEIYQYLETVARNRGFDFRGFPELADAEAWLSGETVASP